jgi:cyclase
MVVRSEEFFRYERLAKGVYAAIDPLDHGGSGGCNAGIIDLGDQTIVFDSGVTPRVGRELYNVALRLTKRPPSHLVVSHYHNDHIRGGQSFRNATEVATTVTRALIATKGRAELKEDRAAAPDQVVKMRRLARSKDKSDRDVGAFMTPYWQKMLASLPEVKLRLPDITFDDKLNFHGTKRSAQLIAFKNGHTESDCVLFLPQERILFCGDLLFVKTHPFLGHGDPVSLTEILNQLKKLKARVLVPGHGPLGRNEDIYEVKSYICTLSAQAQRILRKGGTEEDAATHRIPARYADWGLGWAIYEPNMRFLFRRSAQKRG